MYMYTYIYIYIHIYKRIWNPDFISIRACTFQPISLLTNHTKGDESHCSNCSIREREIDYKTTSSAGEDLISFVYTYIYTHAYIQINTHLKHICTCIHTYIYTYIYTKEYGIQILFL